MLSPWVPLVDLVETHIIACNYFAYWLLTLPQIVLESLSTLIAYVCMYVLFIYILNTGPHDVA